MMLAHQCSARTYLALLVALLFSILLLTAHRLHNGYPIDLPHLPDGLRDHDAGAGQKDPQRDPEIETSSTEAGGSQSQAGASGTGSASSDFCGRDWEFLRSKDLGLTENIVYTRRCVKPLHGDVDRNALGNIKDPLISSTTNLNLNADCSREAPPPCEPLVLEVPPAFPEPNGQYGHLLFGIASTYERVKESLPVFAHWLADTGAQLLAVVADADDPVLKPDLKALEAQYRDHKVNATIVSPRFKESLPRKNTKDEKPKRPAAVEQLHFLLIRDMLEASTPQTQWLGVLDDDTFFPALHPLSVALSEHDHTKPAWLGALADNWISIKIWGYMAYGGAGTFLSVPLARELDPHLEDCVRETVVPSGDGMLRDCMYTRTTTKLTIVDDLYQNDIRGNPAGFFESGRRVLSIHHWKSWYQAPVSIMAAIARVCGDCFLQRWRFGTDTLLANGYSISVYRDGIDKIDLDRMESTFDEADGRFDFIYGPFRPRLPDDKKKSYQLEAVDGGFGKGEKFRQLYVHRSKRDEANTQAVDEVVELVWDI
ncbi:glycosyltransferase family 31 protein [Thermothelomyces thermophilus ATCC 42464]|uniref:Glycosyltransferase family 31 protein n=1 Tax=Thermothelomyces thermophilus (strain ATCC 42464 / BCRC 31852 / DSM 1799) TaxID=573729 RepID=G2QKI7_THET4|nr:glycosyltransferase family 31 protein [Thermothelomyces thermophilus ATCC 42464]AEO60093.1 glycosyltransferase family 31 protein [Thermothelomyces thermophilus ATCC 42464]